MEKRSIFLILFSIIGLITISVMDGMKTSELLQWIALIVYAVVILITLYLPYKKETKKKENLKSKKTTKKKGSHK